MARKTARKPWIPRPEVLAGELDDAIFGIDFKAAVDGTAPKVYSDAKQFFTNTYPATELKKIVNLIFSRLANPKEAGAVVRLSTGFGGGKTHTLVALYHLATNIHKATLGNELLPAAGRPTEVAVAAIDVGQAGSKVFAEHGKVVTHSLWGEIAYQLNKKLSPEIAAVDSLDDYPHGDLVRRMLPAGPVLILLDELVKYMAALDDLRQKRLLSFLDTLISEVTKRPQAVLVITDPASQPVYSLPADQLAKVMAATQDLAQIQSRKVSCFDPIREESARIISQRLFESIDEKAAQKVSAKYHDSYQRVAKQHPGLLPAEVLTKAYAEQIVQCYPFHPRLIKTVQERLAAMPNFQRSRGVLRLFSRILRDVWHRDPLPELICAGDVNWESADIVNELLGRLGLDNYAAVISADIIDHARKLDGSSVRGIHERVASALLLESLPDGSNGFSPEELTAAVLRPEDAGPEPRDALEALTNAAWYTHELPGGRWRFQAQANVNRMIEERISSIDVEDARVRLQNEVQRFFSGQSIFKPSFWPLYPRDVKDEPLLQLVVCDSEERAKRVLAYSDDSDERAPLPRANRNGILAICPNNTAYNDAIRRLQRLLAAEVVEADLNNIGDKPGLEQLKRVKPELAKQAQLQARRAMSLLLLPDGRSFNLPESILVPEESSTMRIVSGQASLLKFLQEKRLIYKNDDHLAAEFFCRQVLPGTTPVTGSDDVYSTQAVKERLFSAPKLQLIPGDQFIKTTICEAVEKGYLVFRASDGTAYDKNGSVTGQLGSRRRSQQYLDIGRITLGRDCQVTLANSKAAVEWLKVDNVPDTGPDFGPEPLPPPPPPAEDKIAEDWPTAIKLARKKALVRLELKVETPADYSTFVQLLPQVSANEITVSLTVGAQLKDGGSANLAFLNLKLQNPIRANELAERVLRAADGSPEYKAEFHLSFTPPRSGMADALTTLSKSAPTNIELQAEFTDAE